MTPSEAPIRWWRLASLCAVLAVEVVVLVVALGHSDQSTRARLDALYRAPDPLPFAVPGTPVRVWKLAAEGVHGSVYGMLYHSQTVTGSDTVVSGYLAIPTGPTPAGGRVIVALGHGTVGTADQCAPSRDPSTDAATINPFLAQGWAVASTDFAGIGGPGRDPYLVGASEGRSMIDAVRSARRLLGAAASSRFLAWGISQGGHGALFTREIVASWAPELVMLGAVAIAPVSDVVGFVDHPTIAAQGITLIAVAGYASVYPDLHPDQVLSPLGMSHLSEIDHECLGPLDRELDGISLAELRRTAPGDLARWRAALTANTPGQASSPVPVLVVQGSRDPIVPLATTRELFRALCASTSAARLDVISGASHGQDVINRGRPGYLAWMRALVDGQAPSSNCTASS